MPPPEPLRCLSCADEYVGSLAEPLFCGRCQASYAEHPGHFARAMKMARMTLPPPEPVWAPTEHDTQFLRSLRIQP